MSDNEDYDQGSNDGEMDEGGPVVEVNYNLNEETEVPGTTGNLFKTVLVEGTKGTSPPNGAKVTVHYVGTLASDGSGFDSSRDRGDPFEFTIGKGQVIKGWDKGVATMNRGEKAILKCLPTFAYGAGGSPPKIPANATLNFEVELLDWSKMDDISQNKDKTIMKELIVESKEWSTPDYESVVDIDIKALNTSTGATFFTEEHKKITVGDDDLPSGLEDAIKSMKKGEECRVHVSSMIVTANTAYGIPERTPLEYVLKLHEFTSVKTWDAKGHDKVVEGLKRKDQGNAYFTQKLYVKAQKKYERALSYVEYGTDDSDKEAVAVLKLAVQNNLANVSLLLNEPKEAIKHADKVLELPGQAANVKALYRKARAYVALGEHEEAKKVLLKAQEHEPGNADVNKELVAVAERIRADNAKQKTLYSNMFARMSKMEEKEEKAQPAAATQPAAEPAVAN